MYVVILLLLIVPSALLRGYVLAKLWSWFVVPLGVDPISAMHAMGISCLIALFVFQHHKTPKDERPIAERATEAIATAFVPSLAVWMFGYIFHAFM